MNEAEKKKAIADYLAELGSKGGARLVEKRAEPLNAVRKRTTND